MYSGDSSSDKSGRPDKWCPPGDHGQRALQQLGRLLIAPADARGAHSRALSRAELC